MRCAVEGCPEEGRYDVGMSVSLCTATSTVETTLLVCIEHADEFPPTEQADRADAACA